MLPRHCAFTPLLQLALLAVLRETEGISVPPRANDDQVVETTIRLSRGLSLSNDARHTSLPPCLDVLFDAGVVTLPPVL